MLVYLYTETEALSTEFIEDCLSWYPPDQVAYVRPAKALRDRRDRCASYLLLLRALEVWRQGIHSLPMQLEDWPTLQAMAQRYKALVEGDEGAVSTAFPLPLFEYASHGKPRIKGMEDVHFNMSHCRNAVAVAVHDSEVGIDVEARRKVSDLLINKACNAEERQLVLSAADPTMEFLRLWTRKESMVKFTGTGLTVDIPSILSSIPADVMQRTTPLPFIDGWLTITHRQTC